MADSLQHIKLNIFNVTSCQNIYKEFGEVSSDRQLCVGGVEGRDSCGGDSGSALMTTQTNCTKSLCNIQRTWKIVGIVSFGLGRCGIHGVPGLYTKVSNYIDWILANVKM